MQTESRCIHLFSVFYNESYTCCSLQIDGILHKNMIQYSKEIRFEGANMKIAIIGYSGSGKSTLAGFLGEVYRSPVLYMDTIQFEAGWKERDEEAAVKLVKDFLDSNNSWIVDGNYTKLLRERRMEESDMIVYMNFSRITCLFQAFIRYMKYKGKARESMAEGCDEKLDFEFIKWILHDGRSKAKKKQYADTINKYGQKVVILKNRRETEIFCNRFKKLPAA